MKQPPTVLKTKKFVASNAAYLSSNNLNAFPINFWVCKQRERQKIFAANLANSPIVAAVKVSSLLLLSSFTSSSHSFFPLTHSLSLPGGPSHYLLLPTLWEKMMMFGEKTDLIIITTGYCFLLFRLANDGLGEWDWLTYFSLCNSITPRLAGKEEREKKRRCPLATVREQVQVQV